MDETARSRSDHGRGARGRSGRLANRRESTGLEATDRMPPEPCGEMTRREEENEDFECVCHIYVETHDGRTSYRLVIERSRDEPE